MRKLAVLSIVAVVALFIVVSNYNADHLAWCESIYHQNVGCPKYGLVEIPPTVIAMQLADHLAWCEQIGHRNVGCPHFKR